jgi:hypothetical protein
MWAAVSRRGSISTTRQACSTGWTKQVDPARRQCADLCIPLRYRSARGLQGVARKHGQRTWRLRHLAASARQRHPHLHASADLRPAKLTRERLRVLPCPARSPERDRADAARTALGHLRVSVSPIRRDRESATGHPVRGARDRVRLRMDHHRPRLRTLRGIEVAAAFLMSAATAVRRMPIFSRAAHPTRRASATDYASAETTNVKSNELTTALIMERIENGFAERPRRSTLPLKLPRATPSRPSPSRSSSRRYRKWRALREASQSNTPRSAVRVQRRSRT